MNNDFPIWRQFIHYNDDEQKYDKCVLALKEKFEIYSGKYILRNSGIQKWLKNSASSGRKWENIARVSRWFNCFAESNLKPRDYERRLAESKRMLRYFTRANLRKTFFSDESIFTVEGRSNAHQNVFTPIKERKKMWTGNDGWSQFPQSVMVSAVVSNLGKTSLFLIEESVWIDSDFYFHNFLSQMITINGRNGTGWIFHLSTRWGLVSHICCWLLRQQFAHIHHFSKELTSNTEIVVHFHFPLFFIPGW